jgi:polysaccharide export outer membrane protein
MRPVPRAVVALALVYVAQGCVSSGEYVWFQQLPPDTSLMGREYLIGVGDAVSIKVLGHEEMTLKQVVRSDGRLALLLIGEVEARGKRPSALKAELEGRLKDYIVSPNVAVNIDEGPPMTVLLMGELTRPGAYPLEQDPSLAHALALGGGLTDYASRSGVFVVRRASTPMRIRFTYESVYRNIGGAGEFPLQRGDIVEVE